MLCSDRLSVLKHWAGQIDELKVGRCDELATEYEHIDWRQAMVLVHLGDRALSHSHIQQWVARGSSVLVMSNTPNAPEGAQLFKLGIKGYLNTYTQVDKLKQIVEVVRQGNVWLGHSVMRAMISDISAKSTIEQAWKVGLTEREIATAEAILQGKSNKEIAEVLCISERTVKAYVHSLLEKFAVKDRLALVLAIQRVGA
jgi:DNA-binding NarL/FixJ family response regulator